MNKKVVDRIYIGLPEELIPQVFWVDRSYRTNLLSHEPGGSDIIIKFQTSEVYGYDWVKFPYQYIQSIFENSSKIPKVEFETFEAYEQLNCLRSLFHTIYLRTWIGKKDYQHASFHEIWCSDYSTQIPWVDDTLEIVKNEAKVNRPPNINLSKTSYQSFNSKYPSLSPEISLKISWRQSSDSFEIFEVDKDIFIVFNPIKDYYYTCAIINNKIYYFHFTSPEHNKEKILKLKPGDKLRLQKRVSESYWSGLSRNQKKISAGDENYFIDFFYEMDYLPF